MKRYFKSSIALSIAVFMVMGLFAGCGSSNQNSIPSSVEPSSQSAPDAASQSEQTGDGFFNPTGYPIVNEPYELDILTVRHPGHSDSFQDSQWFTELQKKTNVVAKWNIITRPDFPERKAIMFASGDLPSVIFGNNGISDSDIISNLAYFPPMNALIETYMPNLMNAFKIEPKFRAAATYLDGNIYTLPSRLPARPLVSNQPFINKVWLDKLGLEIPKTTEDLYNVLYAFKNNNPKGDGSKVIPYTGSAGSSFFTINMMVHLFGGVQNSEGLGVRNGVVTFIPATQEYREAITYMRRLFVDGLIDNEYFTQDSSIANAKKRDGADEQPLVGFDFAWEPGSYFAKWPDQYVTIAPPARPDGKQFSPYSDNSVTRNQYMITTKCERPEVAARWADEFYTFDAAVQTYWGPFDGNCMEKTDDGTWVVLPASADMSIGTRAWNNSTRDFGPKFLPVNYKDFGVKLQLDPSYGDGLKLEISKIGEPYVNLSAAFPNLAYYTAEQTEVINTHRADIRTLVGTTGAQWISQGGVESGWDAYLAQLKSVGLDQWLAAHQAAYDAYIAQ